MDVLVVLGLIGLALVDSTSIGTLVLPIVLLLAPRVHVGRYLAYLATVAGFYAVVGIVLVAGAGWLADAARGLADVTWLRWVELCVGGVLLAIGIGGDPRRLLRRRRPGAAADEGTGRRSGRWRERLTGQEATYATMVSVGLAAAFVEVASMLPFLAAVGIITAAGLPFVVSLPVVLGYVLVMVVPALVLLLGRLALDRRVRGSLTRLSAWLDRHTQNAVSWVLAVVGFVLVQDAAAQVL